MIFGGWEILPPKHGEHFSMDMHGGFFQKVMGDSKDIFPLPPKKQVFQNYFSPKVNSPTTVQCTVQCILEKFKNSFYALISVAS